jgi:hypothetical protein
MVRETVGDVPLTPPDHPAKVELTSGVAVSVTTVPALKMVPEGLVVTVPVPVPEVVTLSLYCEIPSCVTVKVFPATVTVPVLDADPVLDITEKVTEPFPVPLLLEVITIQGAFETTVHVQEAGVDTFTTPVPPDPPKERPVGVIE